MAFKKTMSLYLLLYFLKKVKPGFTFIEFQNQWSSFRLHLGFKLFPACRLLQQMVKIAMD